MTVKSLGRAPLNDLAFCYALSDIGKAELLNCLLLRQQEGSSMEMRGCTSRQDTEGT